MKKDYTAIFVNLDRSGSMGAIASDMIGGFNQFVKSQRELKHGECTLSLYQFDNKFEVVYENKPINDVPPLILIPRDNTALYDSVGKTINLVGEQLSKLDESQRPDKVLVVIITDGFENASHEFTVDKVKEMIEHQTNVYKWEFSYIGANQDAWAVGGSLGIKSSANLSYAGNAVGTSHMFESLSSNVSSFRSCGTYNFSKEDIDAQKKAGITSQPKSVAVTKSTTTTLTK